MLTVKLSASFLFLSLLTSFQFVFTAPTNNKPIPACFTSEIDLSLKWPAIITTTGEIPVVACNGTILAQVDQSGYAALKSARSGKLPNQLDIYMPNSTCFLPMTDPADERQAEAIGSPFNALSTRSVPCGTTLYLPALDGFVLPKGAGVHDGCVRAVNRQAEIKDKCDAVLNIGSVDNASLFAGIVGEADIQIKDCIPGAYKSLSFAVTNKQEEEEDEEFDYPEPTTEDDSKTDRLMLISTGSQPSSDSSDASYSLEEDASYSLSESSDSDIEWVDCDENGNPIVNPVTNDSSTGNGSTAGSQTSSTSTSGSKIVYVYVECDENGNPVQSNSSSSSTPLPAPPTSGSQIDDSDSDIVYVDCDKDGNPILDSSTSEPIEYVDCDENGNFIEDNSEEVEYVDCDENGNPILDDSNDIVYVDCDENGNFILDDLDTIEYIDCDEHGNPK